MNTLPASRRQLRQAGAATALVAMLLAGGCQSAESPAAPAPSAGSGSTDLAAVCPATVVVQAAWTPEAEHGALYHLLNNRTYLGLAVHKGTAYPGEDAAIIDQGLWDKVRAILAENARTRSANTRAQTPSLLSGLIFGPTGAAMSPTHTRKGNRLYRYYVSQSVIRGHW